MNPDDDTNHIITNYISYYVINYVIMCFPQAHGGRGCVRAGLDQPGACGRRGRAWAGPCGGLPGVPCVARRRIVSYLGVYLLRRLVFMVIIIDGRHNRRDQEPQAWGSLCSQPSDCIVLRRVLKRVALIYLVLRRVALIYLVLRRVALIYLVLRRVALIHLVLARRCLGFLV
jgi:hypothetical protein